MASGRVFNPRILLQVAPLLTSTAHLCFAFDQCLFLRIFTKLENRKQSNAILPFYFRSFFAPGVSIVILLHTATLSTGLLNLYLRPKTLVGCTRLYIIGLAFTLGHFAFIPAVAWKVKAIIDDESRGESTRDLSRWLRIHLIRMLSVDIPGWMSLLVATLGSLKFD